MKELKIKDKVFLECPYCGYNNERQRFYRYGTCLRCHKILDKKVYLKRVMWEEKTKRRIKEEKFYGKTRDY